METPGFSTADYVVFACSIAVTLGIGMYFGICRRGKQTTSEYLVGSRQMSALPVAMSLVVTFESSIFMMGTPAEVYFYGFQWSLMSLGWFISLVIAAVFYAPLLHALKITSAFEYLELRYQSKVIRGFGCFLQILYYLIYMGVVLFGPAIALQAVAGFPVYASVLGIAVISVAYTSLGGMKAVVWTDFFQFGVMIVGVIAVIIKGSMEVGGLGEVFRISSEHGRMDFRSLMIAAPWFVILAILACMEGLVAFAYYNVRECDPKESKQITNDNQLIVVFVLQLFKDLPGLAGLFISALFSASLSTLSSGLGSVSANTLEDVIKPIFSAISDRTATITAKLVVVVAGVLAVGISFMIAEIGGTLVLITNLVLGIVAAPMTGIYLLGLLFPCANKMGAGLGALISLAISAWLSLGTSFSSKVPTPPTLPPAPVSSCFDPNITTTISATSTAALQTTTEGQGSEDLGIDVLYTLSPFLYGSIGIAICMIVGLIASLVFAMFGRVKPVDRAYVTPVVHKIWARTRFLKPKDSRTNMDFDVLGNDKEPKSVALAVRL